MRRPFVLAAMLFVAATTIAVAATPRETALVSAEWLAAHLDDPGLVVLQTGKPESYASGHIRGARHVVFDQFSTPHDMTKLMLEVPDAETLRGNLEALGISDGSRVVVTFSDEWYSPATRLLFTLEVAGFGDRAVLLDGGNEAWVRAGQPLTAEPTLDERGSLSALHLAPLVVDAGFVAGHLDSPGYAVVDARAAVFYDGTETGGSTAAPQRRGHILNAGSVPFTSVVDERLLLRPAPELEALFAAAGVETGDTVIAYCHIGQQATAVLLAARALGHPALLYDGSFEDWSKRAELPVATSGEAGKS